MRTPDRKEIESTVFLCSIGADGIFRTIVKPRAAIELSHALEHSCFLEKLNSGKPAPILVDLRNIQSASKEARTHFSMNGRQGAVTSVALVIGSPLSRIIGNFFIRLDKPTRPTRLFTNEQEALRWLLPFSHAKRKHGK